MAGIKRIITSDLGKDAAKQILKQVDDIVTKGKAKQNPEKLLQEQKKKVLIDIALLSHPDNGNIITSAIKKEVTTQLTWSGAAPNPPCICL